MRVALQVLLLAILGAGALQSANAAPPKLSLPATQAARQLIAGSNDADDEDAKSAKSEAKPKPPQKQLTIRQKRERAALEQRRLLQERATGARIERNQQNLDALRAEQAERLRLQQQTQRRTMYQQRQLAQPQQPGQGPRLTPLEAPLYDQTHPRCGVPGMPLC